MRVEFVINSISEIEKVATKFLDNFKGYKIFAFYGELGAGKTTFIKAICNILGVSNITKSPTFSIVNIYNDKSNNELYHIDCYRIDSANDINNIGIEDYIYSNNYCFIEWPEKIDYLLKENSIIKIKIETNSEEKRTLTLIN